MAGDAKARAGGPASHFTAVAGSDGMDEVRQAIDAIRFSVGLPRAKTQSVTTVIPIPRVDLADIIRVEGRVPRAFLGWLDRMKENLGDQVRMLGLCSFEEV